MSDLRAPLASTAAGNPPANPVASKRQDNKPNRDVGSYTSQISTVGDHPIDVMGLADAVPAVNERYVLEGGRMQHALYKKRILSRQATKLGDEASAFLQLKNQLIAKERVAIEARISRNDEAIELIQELARATAFENEDALADAEQDLAGSISGACAGRDQSKPIEEWLSKPDKPSEEAVAARLGLPLLRQDLELLLSKGAKAAVTIGTGCIVGTGITSLYGLTEPDTLLIAPRLGEVLGIAIAGIPVAACSGFVVTALFYFAGQRVCLGGKELAFKMYAGASVVAGGFILAEGAVEREGLLRLAAANSSIDSLSPGVSHASGGPSAFAQGAATILCGASYVGCCAIVGVVKSRIASRNKIAAELEADAHRQRSAFEANSSYKETVAALAMRQIAERRAERRAGAFKAELEALESRGQRLRGSRPEPEGEFTQDQKHRIQDILDRLARAQQEFEDHYSWIAKLFIGKFYFSNVNGARGIQRWVPAIVCSLLVCAYVWWRTR